MRKPLVIVTVIIFCSWMNLAYAQQFRMGYINLKKVLDEYKRVEDGEAQLLKQAEKKNKQRDKLVAEVKKLRENTGLLKDDQKAKKQRELDEKLKRLQDFTYESRTDLRQKRDDKFRVIMEEVKTVIAEYGQSRNYNVIMDDTLLFYKDQGMDVSEEVIKILNQRYKK